MDGEKQFLGTISVLLKSREKNSRQINDILTDFSHTILGRAGINIEPRCSSDCLGVITIFVRGTQDKIQELEDALYATNSCDVKSVIFESIAI